MKGQRAEGMQVKDQRREGMQVRLRLTTTHHLHKLTMTHDIQVFIQDGNGAYAFVGDWDVFENLLDSDGLEPEVIRKMGPGCAPMGMPGRDSQTDRKQDKTRDIDRPRERASERWTDSEKERRGGEEGRERRRENKKIAKARARARV